MGYFKQLHIDCYEGTCVANQIETCYMQPDNPSFIGDGDEDPVEPSDGQDQGDYDTRIDVDQE